MLRPCLFWRGKWGPQAAKAECSEVGGHYSDHLSTRARLRGLELITE